MEQKGQFQPVWVFVREMDQRMVESCVFVGYEVEVELFLGVLLARKSNERMEKLPDPAEP